MSRTTRAKSRHLLRVPLLVRQRQPQAERLLWLLRRRRGSARLIEIRLHRDLRTTRLFKWADGVLYK